MKSYHKNALSSEEDLTIISKDELKRHSDAVERWLENANGEKSPKHLNNRQVVD